MLPLITKQHLELVNLALTHPFQVVVLRLALAIKAITILEALDQHLCVLLVQQEKQVIL